jgi:hypothetical protein
MIGNPTKTRPLYVPTLEIQILNPCKVHPPSLPQKRKEKKKDRVEFDSLRAWSQRIVCIQGDSNLILDEDATKSKAFTI